MHKKTKIGTKDLFRYVYVDGNDINSLMVKKDGHSLIENTQKICKRRSHCQIKQSWNVVRKIYSTLEMAKRMKNKKVR